MLLRFLMPIIPDLIALEHIRRTDVKEYGSKASTLGELQASGFPVPNGFCLSVPAFRKAGVEFQISSELATALHSATDKLSLINPFLAVRSSATSEDLPGVSYAGVYESVIGVSEPDEIETAVQVVWRSYANPMAVAARTAHQQNDLDGGMGVLIQPVINAEVAGVCFSVDPVKPLSSRVVITASWGLGVGVVDGSIRTDTIWLRREDLAVVDKRIVEKNIQYQLDSLAGLTQVPVSEPQRGAACLLEDWARRIAQFSMAVEQLFGQPQDVEWAIVDGKVWILQSRPIASLDDHEGVKKYAFPVKWENNLETQRFWRRTRYECQGTAPLLPLDIDFIQLLESTRIETCLRMGADRNEDLRVINGQIFTSPAPLPISEAERKVRHQAFRDLQERMIREGRTSWDQWGPEIESANDRLSAVDTSDTDGPGLADFLEEAMAVLSCNNMLHPLMWFKPRQQYFEAFQTLSRLSRIEAERAAYRLIEGEESPLTRLIDGLYALAREARDLPAVADWIRTATHHPTTKSGDELADFPKTTAGAARWFMKFEAFLDKFGDRSGHGFGSESLISSPTWRDRPILVIQLVAKYLSEAVESPSQQRECARHAIEEEVQALCSLCPDSQIVEDFLEQLRFARQVMPIVEIHNHHIEQVSRGQLRRALLAATNWLQSFEVLLEADDIFWLTFSEIVATLQQDEMEGLGNKIKARKEEYQQWRQYQPPAYLGLPPALLHRRPVNTEALTPKALADSGKILGIGASTGVVSGRARVIETWESTPPIEPGDILVAENAGPMWLPFFPILAGIVLETGSLGQHAASTAREYGIPAVMDVHNARQIIKDKDWITIDGTKGIIEF